MTAHSWTSSLQNCQKINVHCLSHPDCGILLYNPSKLTHHVQLDLQNGNKSTYFIGWQARNDVPQRQHLVDPSASPSFLDQMVTQTVSAPSGLVRIIGRAACLCHLESLLQRCAGLEQQGPLCQIGRDTVKVKTRQRKAGD